MFRQVAYIALHYLTTTFRRSSTLIFALAMPLAFTLVLGNVIGGGPNAGPPHWPVGVTDDDGSILSAALVAQLEAGPELDVRRLDAATALAQTQDDQLVAALVIPAGFGDAMRRQQAPTLNLALSGTQVRAAQAVQEAVRAALSEETGIVRAARIAVEAAAKLELVASDNGSQESAFQDALARAQPLWQSKRPLLVSVQPETALASAQAVAGGFQQSSPGMMVTFGLVFMLGGAVVLVNERELGTLQRLLVMPLRPLSILLGKLSGIWLAGLAQSAILIVVGALVFGVPWGQAPLALVLVVVAFAFSVSSLGILLAALSRTANQANALTNILMYSVAALGGAWWPIEITPRWMQQLARAMPTFWAMQGFQDIITRGQGLAAVLPEAGILFGFGIVFLTVGTWRFRDEEGRKTGK